MTDQTAECLSCGREFEKRKHGHIFCSSFCRHRGEHRPEERTQADPVLLARLFAADRDPDELVLADDWHPDREWADLDAGDTVGGRREWYERLRIEGLA